MNKKQSWSLLLAAPLLFSCVEKAEVISDAPSPASDDGLIEDQPGTELLDEVANGAAGLRKALGGSNGDGDFCDSADCVATEGDCDSNAQCSDGSSCTADMGGRFADLTGPAANQADDHCAPVYCSDRTAASGPGETGFDCGGPCGLCTPICELPNGDGSRCTYHCPCAIQLGDCDANSDCVGWNAGQLGAPDPNPANRTVCAADVGARFAPMPATHDVCLPAHCTNRISDADETPGRIDCGGSCGPCTCPGTVAGSECTPSCPCAAGGGDCDTNLDCQAGLVCTEEGAIDRCRRPPGAPSFALQFSGASTQYVSNGQFPAVYSTFTMEAWIFPTTTHQIDAEGVSGTGGVSGQRYVIAPHHGGDAEAGAGISAGTNGISVYEHGSNYMPAVLVWQAPLAGWTHVAVVYENHTPRLYVNGALARTGRLSSRPVRPSISLVGGYVYGGFPGTIDEVRIWNVARTPTQIQATMNVALTGNEPGLIAYYPYDEGFGTTTQDLSPNNVTATLTGGPTWVPGH